MPNPLLDKFDREAQQNFLRLWMRTSVPLPALGGLVMFLSGRPLIGAFAMLATLGNLLMPWLTRRLGFRRGAVLVVAAQALLLLTATAQVGGLGSPLLIPLVLLGPWGVMSTGFGPGLIPTFVTVAGVAALGVFHFAFAVKGLPPGLVNDLLSAGFLIGAARGLFENMDVLFLSQHKIDDELQVTLRKIEAAHQDLLDEEEDFEETLRGAKQLLTAAKEGDLQARMPEGLTIGAARTIGLELNALMRVVESHNTQIGRCMSRIQERDLRARWDDTVVGTYQVLQEHFNRALDELDTTIASVRHTADSVARSSDLLSRSSREQLDGSVSRLERISDMSSLVTSISTSGADVADRAALASKLAEDSRHAIQTGARDLDKVSSALIEISDQATDATGIIRSINQIAFQTNLLALNAAIEAARAGDAGLGFAVVADEVRALAVRSQAAAKETAAVMQRSLDRAQTAVADSQPLQQRFRDIEVAMDVLHDVITSVATQIQEQSATLVEVDLDLGDLSAITSQDGQTNRDSLDAIASLQTAIDELVTQTASFQTG